MVFTQKMMVMQVRPNYSIQYQFKPFLKLTQGDCLSKRDFTRYIKDLTTNWKDGDYFIRSHKGTFAYFTLTGNRVRLHKKSVRTGNEYLCWQYFQEDLIAKPAKKKATTKRATKKKA